MLAGIEAMNFQLLPRNNDIVCAVHEPRKQVREDAIARVLLLLLTATSRKLVVKPDGQGAERAHRYTLTLKR
jgi:hypothetical protein